MEKIGKILLLALLANVLLVTAALARPVYLADGGIVEAQSVWREDDKIFVLLNRDSLIIFYPEELDLKKTFAQKWQNPSRKPLAKVAKTAVAPKPDTVAPKLETPVVEPAVTAVTPVTPPKTTAPAVSTPAPTTPSTTPPPAAVAPPTTAAPSTTPPPATVTPQTPPASPKPAPATTTKPKPTPRPAPDLAPPLPLPDFAAGGATTVVLVILAGLLAFVLLMVVSFWKVFTKAGQAGWKSLIPIYNVIVLLEIADCPLWWFLMFFIPIVGLWFTVVMHIKLAERFGKGVLFGFGLCLLGFIFFPILAFDDSVYG